MSVSLKVLSAIALSVAFSFAQYGYSDNESANSGEDVFSTSTYDSHSEVDSFDSENSANSENNSFSSDGFESSDTYASSEENNVGSATASADEWNGFEYEEMGLTQWEFQEAKNAGMSREKLTQLVEKGVRPSEYLQQPWVRLGVSEEDWMDQRTQGLEDSDIDRSYRNTSGDQNIAYLSLLVPSLYQWSTGQTIKAIWMDVLWGAGVGAGAYLLATDDTNTWMYMLIPVLAAHIWSFADAFFGTQWENNPDANRFSFGILPTVESGVSGIFQVRF